LKKQKMDGYLPEYREVVYVSRDGRAPPINNL